MDRELTLVEHLAELRKRLIISLISLGLASIISLPFASILLKILKLPAATLIEKLAFFSPQEAFLIYIRLAFLLGLIISVPVILSQVWAFIVPALDEHFKRQGRGFIFFCSLFFLGGCLFAYFILLPPALKFLLSFASEELEPVISAQRYVSFTVSLILACGFVFQMPVLSFILTKVAVITPIVLRKRYKYAILIIFIVAAIITPTADAFNMLILALPMLFLYEISIWISFFAKPKIR